MAKRIERPAQRNAVIYARYSSNAQNEQSIEGQLRECNAYALREGITIVGDYIDRALTGRSDDRPNFQRMIADAKKGAFQYVLVYKLDRFARNRYDSAVYKHKLKQCGVRVMSAMENIGDNAESIILEAVLEASAEYYSIDLSQKVKRGRKDSAMKGRYLGGPPGLGFKVADHYLVIDELTAPHVQWAFRAYADGMRKRDILEELNRRGLRGRTGKPLGQSALQTMFRSERYIGVLEQSGVRLEGAIPALIDEETFYKVQRQLDLMAHHGAKNKADAEYLLSGKLFCGHCGALMHGVSGTGKGGGRHYYYQCANRRTKHSCKKRHEKKDPLEYYVVQQTLLYVLSPARIKEIAAGVIEQYDKDFGDDTVSQLEKQIAQLNREIEKLSFAAVDMPKAARKPLYDKIETYDVQRTDLEIDLAKLRIANGIRYTEEDVSAWLRSFCKGDPRDEDFRRRIIDVFINSVFLYDDKIIIYYNIRGGKQVTYSEMLEYLGDDAPPPDAPPNVENVCISNGMVHQKSRMRKRSGFLLFTSSLFTLHEIRIRDFWEVRSNSEE